MPVVLNTAAPLPPRRVTSMLKGASRTSTLNCWLFSPPPPLPRAAAAAAPAGAPVLAPALRERPAFLLPAALLSGPPLPPGSSSDRKSQAGTSHRLLPASVSRMRRIASVSGSACSFRDYGGAAGKWGSEGRLVRHAAEPT